ncbi:hypothetical protein FHS19_005339 [Paenibacillus rhizosphaerae]|uniref:Uncharacterized protein n=1 Tax=Paenibacillus rhizosphaerae TaxID=297318 RepID=A0A839TYI5_9BACL|nr:hypothetical protein [Paenibacillus rhizosphaerae]MBB3130620.1 hypothetical protein [Paenibacillus rhizosphaerae]
MRSKMRSKQRKIKEQIAAFAWLQAWGTNVAAIGQTKVLSSRKKQQQEGEKLQLIGNAMQAIANAAQAELTARLRKSASSKEVNDMMVAGNLLQSLGNSLEVIAGDGS